MTANPFTPRGAMGNTHHPAHRPPLTHEEVAALRCRPAHLRTEIPAVGDIVGYRHDEDGPVVAAVVTQVQAMPDQPTEPLPDPLVWAAVVHDALAGPVAGEHRMRHYRIVDDPWPSVVLRVDPHRDPITGKVSGARQFYQTREARLPGAAGWLPPTSVDWS